MGVTETPLEGGTSAEVGLVPGELGWGGEGRQGRDCTCRIPRIRTGLLASLEEGGKGCGGALRRWPRPGHAERWRMTDNRGYDRGCRGSPAHEPGRVGTGPSEAESRWQAWWLFSESWQFRCRMVAS